MKKLILLALTLFVLQIQAQKNVEVGRSTTDYLNIISIYNTDDYTVVILNAKLDTEIGLTLHAPDDESPFVLSDSKGNRYALADQGNWDGPNEGGYGTIYLDVGKVKEFKLYFNKIEDLQKIYSITEVDCEGDGCWGFYDIEVNDNDEYHHPEDVTAELEKVWIDYDVYEDDVLGMMIHANFSIHNMNGKKCYIIIRFINAEGEFLTSTSYEYSNYLGELRIEDSLRPGYDKTVYSDSEVFFPYNEFILPKGDYYLKLDIDLVYANGDLIKHLTMKNFTFNRS